MKTLQKQRQEEADARRAVEASFGTLRKEKQTQDQQTQTQTASTTKLVTRIATCTPLRRRCTNS